MTLIKIETELDLALAVMRILHQENTGEGVLAEDLVSALKEIYEADEADILKTLGVIDKKYGLLWKHVTQIAPQNGNPKTETVKWELLFTSRLSVPQD